MRASSYFPLRPHIHCFCFAQFISTFFFGSSFYLSLSLGSRPSWNNRTRLMRVAWLALGNITHRPWITVKAIDLHTHTLPLALARAPNRFHSSQHNKTRIARFYICLLSLSLAVVGPNTLSLIYRDERVWLTCGTLPFYAAICVLCARRATRTLINSLVLYLYQSVILH